MASDQTSEALEVVAKWVAAGALRGMIEPEWENYPEIGEHDWDAIQCWLESHAASIDPERMEYSRAYTVLTKRAEAR